MADQPQGDASPKPEPVRAEANEDAETRAARRELKQSSISDNEPKDGEPKSSGSAAEEHNDAQPTTPPADEALTDTILSPKKKRAHDQLDEDKQVDDKDDTSEASTDSAKDRASRLEPEKKRHRDEEGSENKKVGSSNKFLSTLLRNAPNTLSRISPTKVRLPCKKIKPALPCQEHYHRHHQVHSRPQALASSPLLRRLHLPH
jgi:DEAD/DEAH box helicase domain-containing protein